MELSVITEMIETLKKMNHPHTSIDLPTRQTKILLEATGTHYDFLLDINRNGHRREKCTFQLRDKSNKSNVLVRFDLIGKNHPNPPGDYEYADKIIPCPHVHIANHPFGTSVALPLDSEYINMVLSPAEWEDIIKAFEVFLTRINVGNRSFFTYNLNEELL